MEKSLKSATWPAAAEAMRKSHLSGLNPDTANEADWKKAFDLLVKAILEERAADPAFAPELADLDADTGIDYDFEDILEEYFDFLEDHEYWEDVVSSAETMVTLFKWEKKLPSEYMFRKGNALEKQGKYEEATDFGVLWLEKYPYDLYAVASNVFLMAELGRYAEAEALTAKYMRDDLLCDENSDTFFMAAFRLYEMTDNINAKQRIEKKIAEYNELMAKKN